MKNDFDLIVHKLSRDLKHINVYPLGDLHIGSPQFSDKTFRRWVDTVKQDKFGYVVLVGDLMDMGFKNSKTNIYESTMTPMQQKEWLVKELEPIRDRILGATQGNHEGRMNVLTGMCPLYDVLAKLDLEEIYRPNMSFIKINLGERNKDRQVSYTFVLAHGQAKGRTQQFPYMVDGMDVMITGHFHTPQNHFHSKIQVDSKNEVVTMRNFMHISVPSFLDYGGYGMKGMFFTQDTEKFPVVRLNGSRKDVNVTWM